MDCKWNWHTESQASLHQCRFRGSRLPLQSKLDKRGRILSLFLSHNASMHVHLFHHDSNPPQIASTWNYLADGILSIL